MKRFAIALLMCVVSTTAYAQELDGGVIVQGPLEDADAGSAIVAPAPTPEPLPAPVSDGPSIDVAPVHEDAGPNVDVAPDTTPGFRLGPGDGVSDEELVRGLRDYRMRAGDTVIGGYGEFNLNFLRAGFGNEFVGNATVRRLVMFLSHNFNEKFRAYAELEWENAIACATCVGSVEIEQAFLDWLILDNNLGIRAGLILVPMGIVNQWHEPPVFHGVNRPDVDQLIIPTTWRELGLGIFGERGIMRYELYAMTAFDPSRFSPSGFANGRGQGAFQRANALAVTGRIELEPWLGAVFGASIYASDAGGNIDPTNSLGQPTSLHVPIYGWSLDARMRKWGFETRVMFTQFFSPEAAALMRAQRTVDGTPLPYFPNNEIGEGLTGGALPTIVHGGYLELAYDVLRFMPSTEQQLLPFVRFEYYDTQFDVPDGFERNARWQVRMLTTGLSYRPIQQIVFKGDIQLRNRQLGLDEFGINFGLGYMF